MSHKEYFKKAAKNDAIEKSESGDTPVVNRFSDTREIDRRRHEVLDYLIMGYDEEEIAEFLGIEEHTVHNDVKVIVDRGFEAREEELVEVRDEIMRIYRLAVKESYRAFRKSQGEVETVTAESGTGAEGNYSKEKVKTEVQSGDSRHMKNMIDAAKEMGKVSGAQKHREVEIQNNIENKTANILSPNRTQMPSDFDRWTKKPEGEELPDGAEIDMEDL